MKQCWGKTEIFEGVKIDQLKDLNFSSLIKNYLLRRVIREAKFKMQIFASLKEG